MSDSMDVLSVSAQSHGKVILFGEHAVVYGVPAIAGSISDAFTASITMTETSPRVTVPAWDVECDLNDKSNAGSHHLLGQSLQHIIDKLALKGRGFHLTIETTLMPASGLGASAAFAVASIRALDRCYGLSLDNEQVNALALSCEKLAHGQPSGLDNTLATYGGVLLFQRLADGTPSFTPVHLQQPLPLIIAHSGKPGFTAEVVARVRRQRDAEPSEYTAMFVDIAKIVARAKKALIEGDHALLAQLMNENQAILRRMQVSCPEIDALIHLSLNTGALGAKLTGSGDGGSVIIYAGDKREKIHKELKRSGFHAFDAFLT